MNKRILQNKFLDVISRTAFQPFFEKLHELVLRAMNIGGGGTFAISGEVKAIKRLKDKLQTEKEVVLFDVGANIGKYSKVLAEEFGQKAIIYAFEPSKNTFEKLCKNVGHINQIRMYRLGISDKADTIELYGNSHRPGLASVYNRSLEYMSIDIDTVERVDVITLDSFCARHNIERIHLLKLDIEGHELKALQGATEMLSSGRIDTIQFEFGGTNIDSRTFFKDFYHLLKENYRMYRILRNGLYEIVKYKETYELFTATNFLAEKRS